MLDAVDLELRSGAVHGLAGQNGCGKSTLIKLMTGALRPQLGSLYIDGAEVSPSSPAQAQHLGIGVVHQDYNLFPDLSVAQNVLGVGGALPRRWPGLVDRRRIDSQVGSMLDSLGIDLAPDALVRSLDVAEMKFVEIARAMRLSPRFLILDEPTASLEPQGSTEVIALLKRLREQGVGLCFVSHRLGELLEVCDEVTVLRDGKVVASVSRDDVTAEKLVNWIVGSDDHGLARSIGGQSLPSSDGGKPVRAKKPVLRVRQLKLRRGQPTVSFELMQSEILGLVGLVGSGASTVVRMVGGAETMRGYLEIDGKRERLRTPRDAKRLGIGFIPEDRKAAGSVAELSVAVNVSLASLDRVARAGIVNHERMRARAEEFSKKLDIKMSSVDAAAETLSGGNLQKVMLAKWLASDSSVLAVEEPTHGVDVGAKAQVHDLLRTFAGQGGSILASLSEVEEALQLCDRIAIFRDGVLVAIESTQGLTEADVTILATGTGPGSSEPASLNSSGPPGP